MLNLSDSAVLSWCAVFLILCAPINYIACATIATSAVSTAAGLSTPLPSSLPPTGDGTTCGATPPQKGCISGYAFHRILNVSDGKACCQMCFDYRECVAWEVQQVMVGAGKKIVDFCVLKNYTGHNTGRGNCSVSGSVRPSPQPPSPPPPSPPSPSPPSPSEYALDFSDMFRGGAVLQRGVPTTVWGWSTSPRITLRLDDTTTTTSSPLSSSSPKTSTAVQQTVKVNASHIWMTHLPPQTAAFNRTLSISDATGRNISVVVSFGETLLCAGQSNMGMQVGPSTRGFDADNATAEAAASVRYSGRIFLHARESRWQAARGHHGKGLNSTTWYSVNPVSIHNFSALCWYSGRALADYLGPKVPVGLAMNAVGAHAIESWLAPPDISACGVDGACTAKQPAAKIWASTIVPMQPYTFGAFLWDQAEQDLVCTEGPRTTSYPCLQTRLVQSWRKQFDSNFPFIAIQLPGYTADAFSMRLAQEAGANATTDAAVIATYDLSCAFDRFHGCPYGNVHNPHKQTVGARVALQLRKMHLGEDTLVTQGPRLLEAKTSAAVVVSVEDSSDDNTHVTAMAHQSHRFAATETETETETEIVLKFSGGSSPFIFKGTRNCTVCCASNGATGGSDFDVSDDNGRTWYNASATLVQATGSNGSVLSGGNNGAKEGRGRETEGETNVRLVVLGLQARPTRVRYTANRIFPQCALYNAEGLPALPFDASVSTAVASPASVSGDIKRVANKTETEVMISSPKVSVASSSHATSLPPLSAQGGKAGGPAAGPGPCSLAGVWNALGSGNATSRLVKITQATGSPIVNASWWLPNATAWSSGTLLLNHTLSLSNGLTAVASASKYPPGQDRDCTILTFTQHSTWCLAGFCTPTPSPAPSPSPPGPPQPPAPNDPETSMPSVMVPTAAEAGALYPDGTPAYYFMNYTGSRGYVIHLSGGGWRFAPQGRQVDDRNSVNNNSSSVLPPLTSDGLLLSRSSSAGDHGHGLGMGGVPSQGHCYGRCDGILSNDASINPLFHDYNKIWIPISGTSFTGDVWGSKPPYVRGRRIQTVVIADLLERHGMRDATNVILTGGSSGGLATYLTCDRVGEQVRAAAPGARYTCLADAGYFLHHNDMHGGNKTAQNFKHSYYGWNSTGGTNQACVAALKPTGEDWKCIFAQYVAPFIKSELFVMQNLYDSWQMNNILDIGCSGYGKPLTDCSSASMAALEAYGNDMRAALSPFTNKPSVGMFTPSCIAHCQSVMNEHDIALWYWPGRWSILGNLTAMEEDGTGPAVGHSQGEGAGKMSLMVGSKSLYPRDVFNAWYTGQGRVAAKVIQQCAWNPTSCNTLCPNFT